MSHASPRSALKSNLRPMETGCLLFNDEGVRSLCGAQLIKVYCSTSNVEQTGRDHAGLRLASECPKGCVPAGAVFSVPRSFLLLTNAKSQSKTCCSTAATWLARKRGSLRIVACGLSPCSYPNALDPQPICSERANSCLWQSSRLHKMLSALGKLSDHLQKRDKIPPPLSSVGVYCQPIVDLAAAGLLTSRTREVEKTRLLCTHSTQNVLWYTGARSLAASSGSPRIEGKIGPSLLNESVKFRLGLIAKIFYKHF